MHHNRHTPEICILISILSGTFVGSLVGIIKGATRANDFPDNKIIKVNIKRYINKKPVKTIIKFNTILKIITLILYLCNRKKIFLIKSKLIKTLAFVYIPFCTSCSISCLTSYITIFNLIRQWKQSRITSK